MTRSDEYAPALTGLRGVAILWVVLHNSDVFPAVKSWLLPAAIVAHSGWIGVQLFFVLSGYLISGKLLDARGSENYYRTFFARRVLRIFPLYFLTLVFFLLILPKLVTLPTEVLQTYVHQPWCWLMVSNWVQPIQGSVYWFPHFWSLAVEEQFYLLWPVVIALVPPSRTAITCVAVIVAAFLARCLVLLTSANYELAYMLTMCRMDALAAGSLVAVIVRNQALRQALRRRASALLGVLLVSLGVGALTSHLYSTRDGVTITVGYLILAAGLSVAVYAASGQLTDRWAVAFRRWMSAPWLCAVGKYSFAMYVFHLPLVLFIAPHLAAWMKPDTRFYPLLFPATVGVGSFALAFVSYHLLEKHFLRLKRFLVPQPLRPPAHVTGA